MSYDNAAKYGLALAGFASLFALVVIGKIEPTAYVEFLLPALAGLGVHAAVAPKNPTP